MALRVERRPEVPVDTVMVVRDGDDVTVLSPCLDRPGVKLLELIQLMPLLLTYEERAELRKMFDLPDMKVANQEQALNHWEASGRPMELVNVG